MSDVVFKGKKFSVERKAVEVPGGGKPVYELIIHNGAVVILAFPNPGEVLLVRQYRPAVSGWLHELPAGTLEAGEDPAGCAGRELEEECGYRAGKIEKLCEFFCSPGVSTEKMYVYVATDLTKTKQALEDYEVLTVQPMPVAEAMRTAVAGQIHDAKTLATLLLWKARNP